MLPTVGTEDVTKVLKEWEQNVRRTEIGDPLGGFKNQGIRLYGGQTRRACRLSLKSILSL